MQVVGTVSAALVLGLVLDILHTAYTNGSPTLSAPQATLMKSVADGVFTGNLPWPFVYIGGAIAVGLILIDLRQERIGADFRVPVLAVAVGIYLPITLTVPIFIGGLINHLGKKAGSSESSEKRGLLMSSGFITGEALMGIMVAVPIFLSGQKDESQSDRQGAWGSLHSGWQRKKTGKKDAHHHESHQCTRRVDRLV